MIKTRSKKSQGYTNKTVTKTAFLAQIGSGCRYVFHLLCGCCRSQLPAVRERQSGIGPARQRVDGGGEGSSLAGAAASRAERIQQLRQQHQQQHRARQGVYPMEQTEEIYEQRLQDDERRVGCFTLHTLVRLCGGGGGVGGGGITLCTLFLFLCVRGGWVVSHQAHLSGFVLGVDGWFHIRHTCQALRYGWMGGFTSGTLVRLCVRGGWVVSHQAHLSGFVLGRVDGFTS